MDAKQLTEKVAIELWELAKDLGSFAEEMAFTPYGKLRVGGRIPRPTYYNKLKRFERHGLVKRQKTPTGHIFIITPKAKALRRGPSTKVLRTDHLSTLILFDIPEEKHNARDTFRRFLIRNGYAQIQKSSFISPFKCCESIKQMISELELEKNVSLFSVRIDRI